jgi:hypothetical protein
MMRPRQSTGEEEGGIKRTCTPREKLDPVSSTDSIKFFPAAITPNTTKHKKTNRTIQHERSHRRRGP